MAQIKGGAKLDAFLKDLSKKVDKAGTMRAGFLEGAGNEPDGTPTALAAAIQNFGAPSRGIPPRPFMSNTVKKNEHSWGDELADLLRRTNLDVSRSLNIMGQVVAGQIREEIQTLTQPQLSEVTLLLRQRFGNNPGEVTFADVQQARRDIASGVAPKVTATQSKPLIWTGHMLQSVESEVTDGGG